MRADRGNLMKAPDWCCPACHQSLNAEANAFQCVGCGLRYPRIGRLPLLTADARHRLSVSAAALGVKRRAMADEIAALAPDQLDARVRFRTAVLEQRRQGLRRNLALLDATLSDVLASIVRNGGPAGGDPAMPGEATVGNSSQLFTDWGRNAEGEREVARVLELVQEELAHEAPGPGADDTRALFLGAGTGRHAVELGSAFGVTRAIDLSLTRMWLFDRVLQGPLEIAVFEDSAPIRSEQLTRFARTEPPPMVPGLQLAVADARHLPLASESMTHVFSLYFTDMLPLPDLLPEVARVLAPGGIFVHVGPLNYDVPDPAWRLAPDELPEAFKQFGLTIDTLREVPLDWGSSPSSGLRLQYNGLVFRARK